MQKGALAIFQCFKNTKKLRTSNPHHFRLVPRIGTFEWLWPMDYKSYETFIALTYQRWRRDRESLSLIFVNTEKSRKYDTLRNFWKTYEVFGIVIKLHLSNWITSSMETKTKKYNREVTLRSIRPFLRYLPKSDSLQTYVNTNWYNKNDTRVGIKANMLAG